MPKHAVGMVIKDRWNLTYKTLMSLYYCDQSPNAYDLYLIDNGSSKENVRNLREFLDTNLLPARNVIFLKEMSISQAWNLFLGLSKNYQFRTKVDNDIVFYNTPNVQVASPLTDNQKFKIPRHSAPTGSVNPGAIPNASIVKGANAKSKNRPGISKAHSQFLVHLEEYYRSHEPRPEIVSLLPVTPGETFQSMMGEVIRKASVGVPYLFGACMMISKACFDKLGYFDERLARRIDVEYTQRAVRNGFRIGYHDSFWALHAGARESTETAEVRTHNYAVATRIQEDSPIETFATSGWEAALSSLMQKAHKNKFLNIS